MDELCAYALSWGMSWELYWYGDMSAVLPYYDKWKREQEAEQIKADTAAWLVGIYVQKAIHSSFSKNGEYPKSPYYLEKANIAATPQEDRTMKEFIQLDDWRRAFARNFHAGNEERN